MKKCWIFGADFSRFGADFFTDYADFSRFVRDINGEKKKSPYWWSFSRLVFHGLPPLEGRGFQIVERAVFSSRGNLLLQGNSYLKSTLRLLLRRRVWGQICYLKNHLSENPPVDLPQKWLRGPPDITKKQPKSNSKVTKTKGLSLLSYIFSSAPWVTVELLFITFEFSVFSALWDLWRLAIPRTLLGVACSCMTTLVYNHWQH